MLGALAFVLPLAGGWCAARACLPRVKPRWAASALVTAIGGGVGVGAASVVYLLLLAAGAVSRATVLAAGAALLCAGIALLWLRRRRSEPAGAGARPGFRWNWLLAIVLAAAFALTVSGLAGASAASPYGEWDAWAIWNLRAKFLVSAGWGSAVSRLLAGPHADYPLLLPGFVAMVWKAEGGTPQWAPALTGFLFLGLVAALLMGTIALVRASSSALLAGFVLLASGSFLFLATMQYADLPLSFYYASAIALLLLAPEGGPGAAALPALAGVSLSLAAWTKNEGLLFAAVLLACSLAAEGRAGGVRRGLARWRWIAAGAAPVLALALWFKLALAPAADPLFHQTSASLAHKLGDPARYLQLFKAVAAEAYNFGQPWSHPLLLVAVLAAALRFRIDEGRRTAILASAATLGLVFLGYCAVYVVTPQDLAWQLQTSLPRLYGHLWPAALLVLFVLIRAPEETAPSEIRKPARPTDSRRAAARSR